MSATRSEGSPFSYGKLHFWVPHTYIYIYKYVYGEHNLVTRVGMRLTPGMLIARQPAGNHSWFVARAR